MSIRLPEIDPSEKSQEELDTYLPGLLAEIHRLKNSTKGSSLEISRTKKNELDKLTRRELLMLMKPLETKEYLLKLDNKNYPIRRPIMGAPVSPEFMADSDFETINVKENTPVYFRIFSSFDNWYQAYLLKKHRKLSDLTQLNI